ncbi:hypothetical protein M0802_016424 [Mischocyttarus mexicanus]|nr:hypothetical protein M0802_016424 [Mischocyttarus mexicanus]
MSLFGGFTVVLVMILVVLVIVIVIIVLGPLDKKGDGGGGGGGGGSGSGGECTSVRSNVYGYVSHLSAQILLWLYAAESRNFTYVRTFVPLQYNIRTSTAYYIELKRKICRCFGNNSMGTSDISYPSTQYFQSVE